MDKKHTKNVSQETRMTRAFKEALGVLAGLESERTGENITKSYLVVDALKRQYPELQGLVREILAQNEAKR